MYEMHEILIGLVGLYVVFRVLDYLIRIPRVSKLGSRYVFITGCDTGFGNAACKKLDKLGVNVFAACLTEAGEVDLKKNCSDRVVPVKLDITNHDSVVACFNQVKKLLPADKGLFAFINNAGVPGPTGPSDWVTKRHYQRTFDVNLFGLIDATVTFLPLLKKAKGRVVNTASVLGRFALPNGGPYYVSKFAVEGFSDCLRREIADFGVTVHIIEPGLHKTSVSDAELVKRSITRDFEALPDDIRREYGQAYCDKFIEVCVRRFSTGASDISPVVDSYIHAAIARFPKARYIIGTDAKYLWVPLSMLPEWIGDMYVRNMAADRPLPAAVLKDQ